MNNKYLLLVFCAILTFAFCKKNRIKKCCTQNSTIDYLADNDSITIFIPNAFTPNRDGINDLFLQKVYNVHLLKFYKITIKKGMKEVFTSNDIWTMWNGTVDGKIKFGKYKYIMEIIDDKGVQYEINGFVCSYNCFSIEDACVFGDMIDPRYGVIYESMENSLCE